MDHLKPLTSLRFAAAAMILAWHASNYFPAARGLASYPLEQGVSFFFVLSGFILTHAYSRRSITFPHFVGLRLARLWPVHLVTAILVILFIRADSQQLPGTGWFSPWLALASNLTLTHALVPFQLYVFSWNSVSWSISTELFFYLAFLFLLRNLGTTWHWKLLGSFGLLLGLAAVASAAGLPRTAGFTELNIAFLVYASPLARGFEFVLGMVTYLAWQSLGRLSVGRMRATGLEVAALALVAWWYFGGQTMLRPLFGWSDTLAYWFHVAGACFAFAPLILAFAGAQGAIGQALSLRPFVWLGEVSFCLYMVHQIVMKWFFIKHLEGYIEALPLFPVLAVCLAMAAALHHLVERPCQRWLVARMRRGERTAAMA